MGIIQSVKKLLEHYPTATQVVLSAFLEKSESQIAQDIFVLCETSAKKNGFFVEFGAGDGRYLSNTFLLEQEFGWSGILSEPNRWLFSSLQETRPQAILEASCIWSRTGETLEFNAVMDSYFSTIDTFSNSDNHFEKRTQGNKYLVETISLFDLLQKHEAPSVIDFLSIDTEGSEFEILSQFDFTKYYFRVIACEHNFSPNRDLIFNLLTSKGYSRIHEKYSQHDDWYIYSGSELLVTPS